LVFKEVMIEWSIKSSNFTLTGAAKPSVKSTEESRAALSAAREAQQSWGFLSFSLGCPPLGSTVERKSVLGFILQNGEFFAF